MTTKFYVAAADCRFGNQKVKIHEQHRTIEVLKKILEIQMLAIWLFTLFLYSWHLQALNC